MLAKATRGAINFHDGPLPRYAGLNAPVWALINRETRHGVTWHLIEGGIDEGDIVEQRLFDLDAGETALTLNTKCYGAAIDSFGALVAALETGGPAPRAAGRSTSAPTSAATPGRAAAARLDFRQEPEELVALVRALDFGPYWNPLARPKIDAGGRLLLVGEAAVAANPRAQGARHRARGRRRPPRGRRRLRRRRARPAHRHGGRSGCPPAAIPPSGTVLPSLDRRGRGGAHRGDGRRSRPPRRTGAAASRTLDPARLPQAAPAGRSRRPRPHPARRCPPASPATACSPRSRAWVARMGGAQALRPRLHRRRHRRRRSPATPPAGCRSASTPSGARLRRRRRAPSRPSSTWRGAKGAFALDLVARDPAIAAAATPDVALAVGDDDAVAGACLTVAVADAGGADPALRRRPAPGRRGRGRWPPRSASCSPPSPTAPPTRRRSTRLPVMAAAERARVLDAWNDTAHRLRPTAACTR